MIDRGGISSVVSVALITLGAIIGVALLWAFISKNIENASSEIVDPDCLTVNLELMNCQTYGACNYQIGGGYYEANVLVKRSVGQGNVTGLRFIFENWLGGKGTYDRNLNAIGLGELQSLQFTDPYDAIPVQAGEPHLLRVAALIGKNKDVCPIASNSVRCPSVTMTPPLGNVSNNTYTGGTYSNSNRAGNCCQHPVNYSECYNGMDQSYPINPITRQLINGILPPGNKTVCCQVNPNTGGSITIVR
ncbi:MAG: hypothetical protein AABX23_01485 [Nanoarchaeota archaeon]